METYLSLSLCLILVTGVLCQEPLISIDSTQTFAHQGDNVTMECRITGRSAGGIVYFGKFVGADFEMNSASQISNNDLIYPPYKDMKNRFSVRFTGFQGETEYLYFHIYNTDYQDSGRYGCLIGGTEARDSLSYEVYRPAEKLYFTVNDTVIESDTWVHLVAGEPVPINCTADEVVPQPEMHIMSGKNEISNKFNKEDFLVTQCKEETTECLLHFNYKRTLYSDNFIPTYKDHFNTLSCTALLQNANMPEVKTSIGLNISFAPEFECSTNIYRVKLGAKLQVKCKIYFNPALIDGVELSAYDGSLHLKNMEKVNGVELQVIEPYEQTPGTVIINWSSVQEKDFILYFLRAANSMGPSKTEFRLMQLEEEVENSAQTFSLSVFCLILATLQLVLS